MITSSQNTRLKNIRLLLNKRHERSRQQRYVVEGVRLLEEAVSAGISPELVLYSNQLSERGCKVIDELQSKGSEVENVTPELMHSLSATENTQGILAVLPIPQFELPAKLDFMILADQIRDPGNLGTLLRTSLAAKVQAVLYTTGTVDIFSPKVVRSAMGAHFRLPLVPLDWETLHPWINNQGPDANFWVSDVHAGLPFWQADLTTPLVLAIGGEAEGITPTAMTLPHQKIHIPMAEQSESLNASIAAGILIFEVVRQRNKPV